MASGSINRLMPNAQSAAMAFGYFVLASVTLRFTRYDGGAAFVWLAGPLLFAGLTVARRRHRHVLALWCIPAMMLSSILFGLGWKVALPLALANVGEAYAAAWCVRRAYPRFGQFRSANEILYFVATAGIMVPALIAIVGAFFVHIGANAPYWPTWRDWFTAHCVGLIAFGPPMTLMLRGQARRWIRKLTPRKTAETAAAMLAVASTAFLTFGQSRIPLLALPFLPMMIATLRLGRFGAVASVAILIVIASGFSLAGVGPTTMIHGGMGLRLQALQLYFATVVMVILPTAGELNARKRVYERLRKAEAINRLMLEHSSDIILRLSLDGMIRYVSPAIRRNLGTDPASLIGRQFATLLHECDRGAVLTVHQAALGSPEETFPVEWQSIGETQAPRAFEAHARAIVNDSGSATGVVYVVRDVTERNLRAIELEARANTDPLTGLVNRRAFDLALVASIAAAEHTDASLVIFDLDHFKAVNDHHGHAAGDLVLTRFAEILQACTRGLDIAARLGGEEFALILRDANHLEATVICERIRNQLAGSFVVTAAGVSIHVTVSAGLKQIERASTPETLLKEADSALYHAKHAGRNQVALAA